MRTRLLKNHSGSTVFEVFFNLFFEGPDEKIERTSFFLISLKNLVTKT
jgi:hypothetical protein